MYGKNYFISGIFLELLEDRIASLNETDEQLLKSRFVVSTDISYPSEALHTFAENKPAHSHNLDMLTRNEIIQHCIPAIDELP